MSTNKKVRVVAAIAFTCLMTGILISSFRRKSFNDEFEEDEFNSSLAARVRKKYNIPNASRADEFVKHRNQSSSGRFRMEDESGILL